MSQKKNFKVRKELGITLIALVVTITVLLILAGITIQLVLSDGGIFSQANRAKEQTRIGELLEKFNMSEAVLAAEKLGQTSLEEYIKKVQEEGYVVEAEEQEDGNYHVVSEDGYVFQVSIIKGTDTNDIVIEYIGKAGNLPLAVRVKNITTNSAELEVIRAERATNFKYEYKKHGDTSYQTTTGTGNTCILNNLTSDTIYDVKITVTKDGQEIVIEKQIAVGKIPTGGTIKLRKIEWADEKATATVYHEETGNYRIEWQKQGETTWNQGTMGEKEISIPNLNHRDLVYLRLNDGNSSGADASLSIEDSKNPQPATISFSPEIAHVGENITATVIIRDNETGIDSTASKYEFNQTSTPLGTEDESLYTTGTFASTTTPTIKATAVGTWYLHVLSVDKAGNKLETVKTLTTESAKVSSITIAPTSTEIEMGKTVALTATVNPTYAEDKSVTWSSNEQGIATVDQTGKVTGIAIGTVVITATANDESGVVATCNITVKAPTPVTIGAEKADWELMDRIAGAIAKDTTVKESSPDAKGFTEKGEYYEIAVGQEFSVKYNGTALKVRVLGFKHDTLAENTSYGNAGTKASISFEFTEFLGGNHRMHSSDDNSVGWKGCEMRNYLNGSSETTKGGLVTNLSNKDYIKKVTKPYLLGTNATTASTDCSDWLWLLSCSEIWDKGRATNAPYGYAKAKEGERYKFYQIKNPDGSSNTENTDLKKRPKGGSVYVWRLRSPSYSSSSIFCIVNSKGYSGYGSTTADSGVAPCFSI